MVARFLKLLTTILGCFWRHTGNNRQLESRARTVTNEVCSLLDVVVEVLTRILVQTTLDMKEVKAIQGSGQHAMRTSEQAYDGVNGLTEPIAAEELLGEAQAVRRVLVGAMAESKGLGEATNKVKHIRALSGPRRKTYSSVPQTISARAA